MEEREEMERMINGIIDGVYVGNVDKISTREIQEIKDVEDREYEAVPEELKNKEGI